MLFEYQQFIERYVAEAVFFIYCLHLIVSRLLLCSSQCLACDNAEASPDDYVLRVAQFNLAKQQEDVILKLGVRGCTYEMLVFATVYSFSFFPQMQTKELLQNPETADLMKQRAAEHEKAFRQAHGDLAADPHNMMRVAMEKMALARKVLAAQGKDENVCYRSRRKWG